MDDDRHFSYIRNLKKKGKTNTLAGTASPTTAASPDTHYIVQLATVSSQSPLDFGFRGSGFVFIGAKWMIYANLLCLILFYFIFVFPLL
jgi:hypothetical protein